MGSNMATIKTTFIFLVLCLFPSLKSPTLGKQYLVETKEKMMNKDNTNQRRPFIQQILERALGDRRGTSKGSHADHRLTTDISLRQQASILATSLCPRARHHDGDVCRAEFTKWWPPMARCLFPHFIGGSDVCGGLGLCKAGTGPVKTCGDCTGNLNMVANYMKDPEIINMGVAYLKVSCFCKAPGHTNRCNQRVSEFLPPAMEVLSGALVKTTKELCQDVVGVCLNE